MAMLVGQVHRPVQEGDGRQLPALQRRGAPRHRRAAQAAAASGEARHGGGLAAAGPAGRRA
eukprot:3212722-Prymnesium_polylepis.1